MKIIGPPQTRQALFVHYPLIIQPNQEMQRLAADLREAHEHSDLHQKAMTKMKEK